MRKNVFSKILAALSAVAMGVSLTACGGGSEDKDTVKVGLLHSLTGSMAISEKSVRDAEVLAIEEINAAGGVLGKQIEYADMDQTDFAAIIAKIESAKPDVIINTLKGTGNVSFFKQMSEKNYTSADYMTMSFSIAECDAQKVQKLITE